MAFYELEPWGSHYDDLRAGTIASMLANINRDTKVRKEPFGALEFMPWNEHQNAKEQSDAAPVLLDDPDKQSELLLSMMFPNKAR